MSEKSELISRRDALKKIVVVTGAVATTIMMWTGWQRLEPYLSSFQYQDHPKGKERCAECANFVTPHGCTVVAGIISPNGWCIAFAPKSARSA